jgi:hypothetical protein
MNKTEAIEVVMRTPKPVTRWVTSPEVLEQDRTQAVRWGKVTSSAAD